MLAIIVIAVAALVLLLVILGFNSLVRSRNKTDNAWAQVDVQLTKRHDLIPNLVETVKGYAAHERQTFEAVTAARTAALNTRGPAAQAGAENALTAAVGRLMAVAENYPQLRSSANFLALQDQLSSVESGIAYARQYYNDSVLTYENRRNQFPLLLIAGPLGFGQREYFKADAAATEPVATSFTASP
ncbi:MAG: LemA protein [Frankiaceae bacterium]|nr:LemA protein [Frankiaceae bacterium]